MKNVISNNLFLLIPTYPHTFALLHIRNILYLHFKVSWEYKNIYNTIMYIFGKYLDVWPVEGANTAVYSASSLKHMGSSSSL